MKKYRLIIEPPAFDDLDESYQWIKQRSPEAAVRWFNGFVDPRNPYDIRTVKELLGHKDVACRKAAPHSRGIVESEGRG